MERTFGVKDFVLLAVLSLLIVLVGLAMVQFDRQWDEVQSVKHKLEQQAADIQTLQRTLDRGVAVANPGATTAPANASSVPAAEDRVAAARTRPDYAEGDWLVYGFGTHIASLTPFIGGDAYSVEVIGQVQETLAARDAQTLEWKGLLAESWKVDDTTAQWEEYAKKRRGVPLTEAEVKADPDFPSDGTPDEQKAALERRLKQGRTDDDIGREKDCPPAATFTFKLRPNLRFSDGVPVTPDDVVFSFDFMMNPAIAAPRERGFYSRIREVKKLSDDTVAFAFRVPYYDSMSLAGGLAVMPKHFYSKFKPEEFNRSTGLLLGSGAYQLDDPTGWKPGKPIQLVRNPRYWGVMPAFSRINYQEFTNPVAQETSFRNREIDQIGGLNGASPDQYAKIIKDPDLMARSQAYAFEMPNGGYRFIAWNQVRDAKPTKFADKRVRQAMGMLIDRRRLIDEVMLGLAAPTHGPFNPTGPQADPQLKPISFDPATAAKLLADAGWVDRGEGVLTNAAGEKFEFKLTYPSGRPNYEKMVLLLRDAFAGVKIRLIAEPTEFSVFSQRLKQHDFDAITMAWGGGAIEGDPYQIFHSSQIADGGDDFVSYRNPEYDAANEQARKTLDEKTRMALWHKCDDLLNDDQPYAFLFSPKTTVIMDKRFANVQRVTTGLNPDAEWYVTKSQQRYTTN